LLNSRLATNEPTMPDRQETLAKVLELIEPFNKKGIGVTESTRFAQDLEWDSLTVLDFVANIEDEFDVLISMNMQAEIETVGQLVDALEKLKA
jgi:acyl carrier protein